MACYVFESYVLDSTARRLLRDDQPVEITAKVFETLLVLIQNRGRVLDKDELLSALWPDTTVEEANLAQSISTLRRVLQDTPKEHRFIATVPGRGYSFVASVVEKLDGRANGPVIGLAGPPPPVITEPRSPARRRSTYVYVTVICALLLIGSFLFLRLIYRSHQTPAYYSSVPLTGYPGEEATPSLAPDGKRVAFAWNGPNRDNFDIYVKEFGIVQPIRLTTDPGPDISPAWSPDGRTVAFLHMLGNQAEVSLIPAAAGSGPRRKLATIAAPEEHRSHLRFLAWSGDGKFLVVSKAPEYESTASLYLLNRETGEEKRLTSPPPAYDDCDPAFSPDMKHLAFIRYTGMGATAGDVYILNLAPDFTPQGEPQRITSFNRKSASPVWTPDGRAILFARHETGGSHSLWRVNVKGFRQVEPLRIAVDNSFSLALSVSGHQLVYTRTTYNENIWAAEMPSGPAGPLQAVRRWSASTSIEAIPQFSPDGRHVAFQSFRSGKCEIWVSERDGSNARQLTNLGATISGFPRWSPDGQKIVFHSRPEGDANLYLIDLAGGDPKQLTKENGNNINPSWSHDGRWIYFTSRRTGEPHIWKIPSDGGTPVQVSRQTGFCPLESVDGRYLYFTTPDYVLWRIPLAGGPEEKVLPDIAGGGSAFAPARNGIYFIRNSGQGKKQELALLHYTTGRVKTLIPISGTASLGLTVSPDEHLILYGQIDQAETDLMLVDQFRWN